MISTALDIAPHIPYPTPLTPPPRSLLRSPTVLTNVIMLTPWARVILTALVEGSIARASTGTEGTAVHSHSLLTGLL